MKDRLCVNRQGEGCLHCKLVNNQTMMKCEKGLWDRGNGMVKLTLYDHLKDGTIAPRVREVLKTGRRCPHYELDLFTTEV